VSDLCVTNIESLPPGITLPPGIALPPGINPIAANNNNNYYYYLFGEMY
jgi:hypothetical protein